MPAQQPGVAHRRSPRHRAQKGRRAARAAAAAALLLGGLAFLLSPAPAGAAVQRLHGFRATVDGWTSWYGSYGMGELGPAWCLDHGGRAPDPAYHYQPTDLADLEVDVRVAIAWAAARHGAGSDPVIHAGLMLAIHDLAGARYPSGRLDVDRIGPERLAGFGGREADVLRVARWIKAEALAQRHLRDPIRVELSVEPGAGGGAVVTAVVLDAAGHPIPGAPVRLSASGGGVEPPGIVTGPDGRASASVTGQGRVALRAVATVPVLTADAWAASARRAQRVVRPAATEVAAQASVDLTPQPGSIRVEKRDAVTGGPIGGARIEVRRGTAAEPGEVIADEATGSDGVVVVEGLDPGEHLVTELRPAPGYAEPAEPIGVTVRAGEQVAVALRNRPVSSVEFRKVPGGLHEPEAGALAGAVLVVTGPGGHHAGSCTTAADGACALPDGALTGGVEYCWREEAAPPGWGLAEGGCFVAAPAGGVVVVEVLQPSLHGEVAGIKLDAATGRPLAGATFDLYRMHQPPASASPEPGPAAPEPDPAAPELPGGAWVGVATSGAAGELRWPPQLPGHRYCALEREAPPGYARDLEPRCTAVPLAERGQARLELLNLPAAGAPAPAPPASPPLDQPPAQPTPAQPAPAQPAPARPGPAQPGPAQVAPVAVLPSALPDRPESARLAGALPRTGVDVTGWALVGGGLVLLGSSLGPLARPKGPSAQRRRAPARLGQRHRG